MIREDQNVLKIRIRMIRMIRRTKRMENRKLRERKQTGERKK